MAAKANQTRPIFIIFHLQLFRAILFLFYGYLHWHLSENRTRCCCCGKLKLKWKEFREYWKLFRSFSRVNINFVRNFDFHERNRTFQKRYYFSFSWTEWAHTFSHRSSYNIYCTWSVGPMQDSVLNTSFYLILQRIEAIFISQSKLIQMLGGLAHFSKCKIQYTQQPSCTTMSIYCSR